MVAALGLGLLVVGAEHVATLAVGFAHIAMGHPEVAESEMMSMEAREIGERSNTM